MARMGKIGWLVCALTAGSLAAQSALAMATPGAPRLKPPAPGPAFIEKNDLGRLKAVREAVSRRQYSQARAIAGEIGDPTARSLADWYYFEAEDPLVSIGEADSYLDRHPEWPSVAKIQSHVEKRLLWTTAPSAILDFFDSRDPLTGEGKIQLARAQFATGAKDAGVLHVKDAWINHNFILADEQRVLANYGGMLSADDHQARVDRLLWAREASTAKRAYSRLRADDRRRAEARAALLLGGADGPRLFERLSDEDRADPGVQLAAIRYFRRKEEEPRAIAMARAASTDPVVLRNPGRFWDEQKLLMRWALKNRQYADAYAMASHHALAPGSPEFAEAEFNAGWIALRFLDLPERAEQHFAALTGNVGAPISLSRGWYWLGRAAEAKGEAATAEHRYRKAAEHIYTFYGQLAAEKVGGEALNRSFEATPPATADEKARFGSRPAVAALRMLTDIRDDRAFLIFAYAIDDALTSRGEFRELADLAMRMSAPHVAVRAGKVAVRAGAFSPEVAYPEIAVPSSAAKFAPIEMILGISRQESEFNPRAYSRAGARGMMQLIPSTAQLTARKERLTYRQSSLLDDPNYNMTLGAAHLSHLLRDYDGSWIMTFAAYNAGPNRVTQWREAYGDPRSPGVDPLDWIEQIPFEETRNYVQRVLENAQIYRSRLTNGGLAGRLAADIERGGANQRIATIAATGASGMLPDLQPRIAALAEPVLEPLAAASDALSHPAPEPLQEAAKDVGAAPAARTPARVNRRPSFRPRKLTPEPAGNHDENQKAATPTPIAANSAPPAPDPIANHYVPPLTMSPVDSGASNAAEVAPADPSPAAAPPPALIGAAAEGVTGECITYSDFIAETAKEEASADDLNAGALAELRGGGDACN